ncbi:MAG: methyl-accepting chemotaxis protein, partial [Spirochaetaceae bacterium]
MLRKMKIGSKTIVTVALLVVGVAAGIGITTYFQARAALGAQVQDTITHQAHEAAILVRSELDKYLLIGRELAENPQIKGMDLPTQLIALEAMTERLGFLGMGIIDSGGTAHYPDGTQAALGDRAYFREAMGGAASFSDVLISRVTNSAVMILAVPILGSGTAPTAVLLIRLDAGWLSEITDRIGYGDGGYAYMIDRTGAFIAHDQRDYVLEQRNFLEEGRTNPDLARLSQMLQRMTQGHAGYDEYVFMGSLQFAGFAPIARSDWSIAIGGYRDRIFRSVDQMRSTTMLIAVFFIVVGVVAAVIFARSISSPINTLVAGADQLSVGDIQVSGVDPKAIARINQRQDELGAIGRAFSGIIEYQRQKVAIAEQIASRNLTVETAVSSDNDTLGKAFSEMVESLNSVLGQVQEAVEQVAAGATQVSTASQDLSQGATESASSLEQITASINQI